jgi:hypothetical protein
MELWHAWRSKRAEFVGQFAVYKRPDGRRVAVVEVCKTKVPTTKWPDLEYIGQVISPEHGGCVQAMKPFGTDL